MTEPGTLMLASHATTGAVFLLSRLGLQGLVNYLTLQLLPEGCMKFIGNAPLSPCRPIAPYIEGDTWVGW